MNCQQLRLRYEDPPRLGIPLGVEAEHLATCSECAQFVEARRQLGSGLQLLRQSLPLVPSTLDAAILAGYRRVVEKHESFPVAPARPRRIVLASLAAAVLVLMAAFLFHAARKPNAILPAKTSARVTAASEPVADTSPAAIAKPAVRLSSRHHKNEARSARGNESSSRADFRSLMYCDELSCGGPMQVIRIQLPPFAAALAAPSATGTVMADVLVGPDGIARGIRVVE